MREITYAQAIREAMCEEMQADPDVFLMGEDIGVYGGAFGVSLGMLELFGSERVIDTPISELGYVGAGVGAALAGMRPVIEVMYADFLTTAFDQVVNQAAKIRFMFGGKAKIPIVIRTPEGSGTGAAGQHSQCPEAWLANVPGLILIAPSTPYDAKGLLKAAIRSDNPVVFFESKLLYKQTGEVPDEAYVLPIGCADIKRQGSDITLITYGRTTAMCLEAAQKLHSQGISAEVIDIRTLAPLDTQTLIQSVLKTHRVLIVHEAPVTGGFGAEIAAVIASEAFYHLAAPVTRLCGMDTPVPFSRTLERAIAPDTERIAQTAMQLIK